MSDLPRRTIVREHEFDEQVRALIGDMEEADNFTAGAEDLLARHPESGMPAAQDNSVWYLAMSPVRGRRVSLFYSFDESTVVFLAILPFDD